MCALIHLSHVVELFLLRVKEWLHFLVHLGNSDLKTIPSVNEKNELHLEHRIEDGDFCNYCNLVLTGHNSVIFNFCSDDYDHTICYCKPCGLILTKDMNIKTASANGIKLCHNCCLPKKKECKCKFDTKLKQKWK